jgi:orotate phosphoribosyltransferase
MMARQDDVRDKALQDLQRLEILMVDGHFDYGNGYHGRAYLNAHQLFRQPSTIWRFAQDLIDVLPFELSSATEVVAGPVTGGALLAHTIAGLLDGRRSLTHPPCLFAPFNVGPDRRHMLRGFYARQISGKRVLLADDVRNTGETFRTCAALVAEAGGTTIGSIEIYDRLEAVKTLDVPNVALAEYRAPDNYAADNCPLCAAGQPITSF